MAAGRIGAGASAGVMAAAAAEARTIFYRKQGKSRLAGFFLRAISSKYLYVDALEAAEAAGIILQQRQRAGSARARG